MIETTIKSVATKIYLLTILIFIRLLLEIINKFSYTKDWYTMIVVWIIFYERIEPYLNLRVNNDLVRVCFVTLFWL